MNQFGRYYPENSFWHQLDPRTKLLILLVLMSGLLSDTLFLGSVIIIVILYLTAKLPVQMIINTQIQFGWFLVPTFLLNLLIPWFGEGLRFTIFHNLTNAFFIVLKLAALLAIAGWVSFVTKPIVLIGGINRVLRPVFNIFKELDLPLLMNLVIRFIPDLYQEIENIKIAQRIRGIGRPVNWRSGGLWVRCTVIPVFIAAIRKSSKTATAMVSRGYQPGAVRTVMEELRLRALDRWLIVFSTLLLILVWLVG